MAPSIAETMVAADQMSDSTLIKARSEAGTVPKVNGPVPQ